MVPAIYSDRSETQPAKRVPRIDFKQIIETGDKLHIDITEPQMIKPSRKRLSQYSAFR